MCVYVAYFAIGGVRAVAIVDSEAVTTSPPGVSANTTLVNKTGGTITVVAGVGRENNITVWQVGAQIRVRDTGDNVIASGDCWRVGVDQAACPAADTTEVVVIAGDQDDVIVSTIAAVGVTLIGGDGNDVLTGGAANDTLEGNQGDDHLTGGAGNDTLTAGAGDDTVFAGAGNDTVDGQAGMDRIFGGGGNDVLEGEGARDVIVAGPGADIVSGGAGPDVLNAVDGVRGNDFVDGGPGADACAADPEDTTVGCS